MKMTIEANGPEEMYLLSKAVAACIGFPYPAPDEMAGVAVTTGAQNCETGKDGESPVPAVAESATPAVATPTNYGPVAPHPSKRGRGRPPKVTEPAKTEEAPVATPEASAVTESTEAVEYENVDDAEPPKVVAVDFSEFRNTVVKKSDEPGMREAVVEILKKHTSTGTSKTADVPEDKRQLVLDELAKLEAAKVE